MIGFYYELNSLQNAEYLCNLCNKYKDIIKVDVQYNTCTVDGCSRMGILMLIGNTVIVHPITDDIDSLDKFIKELNNL